MRPLQLLIATLLGACIVLLILLATVKPRECAPVGEAAMPVQIVDSECYSCGSGSGPFAYELVGDVGLAEDETVIAIGGLATPPMRALRLVERLDAYYGRKREHGQSMQFDITGPRGNRRVVLVLH